MFGKIKELASALRMPSTKELEEAYLNEAQDLVDLEYRMAKIDKGMFR